MRFMVWRENKECYGVEADSFDTFILPGCIAFRQGDEVVGVTPIAGLAAIIKPNVVEAPEPRGYPDRVG